MPLRKADLLIACHHSQYSHCCKLAQHIRPTLNTEVGRYEAVKTTAQHSGERKMCQLTSRESISPWTVQYRSYISRKFFTGDQNIKTRKDISVQAPNLKRDPTITWYTGFDKIHHESLEKRGLDDLLRCLWHVRSCGGKPDWSENKVTGVFITPPFGIGGGKLPT